jgi:uncharacterized protein YecE (DUF72 family)
LLGSEPAGCYTDTCGEDFVYLRFIGDRSIDEKDFGRLQKDRIKELRLWSHSVQGVKNKAKYAIVAANNHYAGFGPATANSFRKMVGLKEAVWEEMKQSRL